jgi:predicted DNA-binding WGR domain protein/cell wall assembly regulator SMI1
MASASARRFEMVGGGHSKFWQIAVKGSAITVRFGRIGSNGVEKTTVLGSPVEAAGAAKKLVLEKTNKGYVEVKKAPAPPVAAKRVAKAADKGGDVLAKLSALWSVKRPTLEKGLRKGATGAQLAAFEKKLGLRLPKAFHDFYSWHDGAKDENEWFEGGYGLFPLAMIVSHKQMVDEVRGDDGTWDRAWVPFLQSNYSDTVCVDTKTGEVFEWANSGGPKSRVVIAPSFEAWVAQHVAITEGAKSLEDDDEVYGAFTGAKAKRVRAGISPGYPKSKRD